MAKLNKTPLTIRSKRGTEAEITSYTGYQLSGEIAYATDTKDFYVSDGSQFNKIASFPFTGSAQIQGLGTTSATTALRVENSNGDDTFIVRDDGKVGVGCTDMDQIFETQGSIRVRHSTNVNRKLQIGWGSIYPLSDVDEFAFLNGGAQNSGMRFYGRFHSSSPSIGNLFSETGISIGKTLTQLPDSNTHVHVTGSDSDQTLFKVSNPSNPSLFSISGSGNVGIGTSNPEYITDIQSPNQTNNIPAGDDVYNIFNVGYSNSNFNIANKSVFTVGATAQNSGRFVTEIRIGGGSDTNPHFIYYGNGEANGFRLDRSNNNLVLFNNVQGKGVIIKQTPDGLSSSARLQVRGDGTTSATTALLVENSNGDDILKITDDGAVSVSPDYNGGGFSVNSTQGIRSDSPSNAAVKIIRNNNVGYFAMLSYFDGNSVMWQTGTPKNSDNANFAGTEYIIAQSSRSSPAITINTSDNVGIGTTSPNAKLNISGSDNENLLLVESPSNGSILVVTGSGNIGIGTTPTEGRLHVKGEGSNSATTAFLVQNAAGADLLKVVNDGQLKLTGNKPVSFFGLQAFEGSNQDGNHIRIAENSFWNSTRINSPTNITEDNDAPDVSAMLQVDSTTKGFLPPRMTTTQINNISEASAGLIVYDTTINNLKYYDSSSWSAVGDSGFPFTGSAQIQGLGTTSATTAFRVENANADEILKVTDDGALDMPTLSSGSNIGLVKRDGDAFLYRFSYGDNGTTTPLGRNIFIGKNTGNFTVGATATANYMGSDNIGVGDNALTNLTSGNRNIAIGQGVGASITTAGSNVMMGWGTGNNLTTGGENFLLGNFTGGSLTTHKGNIMIGTTVAQNIQGFYNVAIGDRALQGSGTNQNAGNNVAIGRAALQQIKSYSDSNVAIGSEALKNIGGNADGNIAIGYQTGINNSGSAFDYNILIGYNVQAPLQNTGNQLNIGNLLYGTGVTSDQSVSTAGKIGIGQTSPDAKLHITGEGTTSATSALKIENATPTTIFDLKDNGQFTVGPSNGSISINSDGEVTISASNPALTIAGASQPNITFDGGQGSLTGLRTINRTGEIRINTTQGTRFGETSLSIGGIVDIVGKYDKVPLGIKQQAGTSQTRFATFLSSSGDEVLGITTDGGFYVRDSTLVKRYVFDHDYLPTHVDGLTTGLDFRTENQSGALTTFGYIDVTNDDSTLQESSMRFSVGQTTPTEVMRLQNDGNVGIGTTSPDASAILDIASTSKGVVFPRMTSAQRTAISSPTTGLIVYQTDATEGLYIYKSTGWVQII